MLLTAAKPDIVMTIPPQISSSQQDDMWSMLQPTILLGPNEELATASFDVNIVSVRFSAHRVPPT